MKKVLIVDDEVLMRVTLRSMIAWEKYGMEIAADCSSAYQALEYLDEHTVDLMITDVKMPGISGLELLKQLKREGRAPITVILSGYNEFDLVREAFRLGASDYIIKGEMSQDNLGKLLTDINLKYWGMREPEEKISTGNAQVTGKDELTEDGMVGVAVLEIDDFQRQCRRFGDDLAAALDKPMWELVAQIPKIRKYGSIRKVHAGYYIFLYRATERTDYRSETETLLKRMQSLWKDYMNLTVSAAVCDAADASNISVAIEKCEELLLFAPLIGKMALICEWNKESILDRMNTAKERYEKFLVFLYDTNEPGAEQEKQLFLESIRQMDLKDAKEEILCLISLLALKFREYDGDFYQLFPEEINYYEKIARLENMSELERWFNNYFTWVLEYLKQQANGSQTDIILRAKRFVTDNFSNSELSLGNVAEYIGWNEKYFSTMFTQKTGSTFRDYLTHIRMEKAKQLLRMTDLKMYEICENIGYNNVEHFNRMFKRATNMSPGTYRKKNIKN